MIIAPNRKITDHFDYSDLRCPCCNTLIIDELLYTHMKLLEKMRATFNFPISINSAHRCKAHNKDVGGEEDSMHLKFATDVRPSDNDPAKLVRMIEIAPKIGFTGIGIYRSFAHLDCRPSPARWESK